MEKFERELAPAHEAIEQLFEQIGITRVVCIDDEYSRSIKVEDVIGYCAGLNSDDIAQIPHFSDFAAMKDVEEEVFNSRLQETWKEMEDEQRKEAYRIVRFRFNSEEELDIGAAFRLRKILSHHNFRELSLTEWKDQKEDILTAAAENISLLLFDQDMISEGGTEDEGIKQIAAVIAKEELSGVYYGLLSHTGSIDEEPEKWEQLAKVHNVPKSNFLFIAKHRLNQPLGFARMLKLMTISPDCHKLNKSVGAIYKEAIDQAKKEIDNIGIYDFEHIVFSHAQEEGIWEPDMLFRLYNLFHKRAALKIARENDELNILINHIRQTSHIPLPSKTEETPKHNSWKIQKTELYEEADYINSLHLPIELGDIFEYTTGGDKTKKYVLLGQPCDLMVRQKKANGRGGGRHHTVTDTVIAEIEEHGLRKRIDPLVSQILPYFSDSNKVSYVMFRKTVTIRLSILDLCAFQKDGAAKLNIVGNCPENIIHSWKEHYVRVQKEFKKALDRRERVKDRIASVSRHDRVYIFDAILPITSLANSFKGKIDGQTIEYPLKRIGRIMQTRAVAILSRYAGYLARTAFDRDFGEEIGKKLS